MAVDDALTWLMNWYAANCDGGWEHQFGVRLDTLDNPGWQLTIDLEGTALEDRTFSRTHRGDIGAGVSWSDCRVVDKRFEATCGARDLMEVIAIFRRWAEVPA